MFGSVRVETVKNAVISNWNPSHSDGRFSRDQTIYLAPGYNITMNFGRPTVEGLTYEHDDRIYGLFSEKEINKALNAAKKAGATPQSAEYVEVYLRTLYKDPALEVIHIIAGVNHSSLYSFRIFGFKKSKTTK